MKRKTILVLLVSVLLTGLVAGCGTEQNKTDQNSDKVTLESNTYINKEDPMMIKLSFNGEEILVKTYDNPTSQDFISLLPMSLTFQDYAGTEKVSDLPRSLSTENAPAGFDPNVGDLTLYAPWGNLAIFYQDFGYSNGLISLGKIESGIEKLKAMSGSFDVLIEKVE